MTKKKVLKKLFSLSFDKLTPSRTLKSELFFLDEEEFKKLLDHMGTSSYTDVDVYDTVIIQNYIFKLDKKLLRKKKLKKLI